MDGLTWPPLVRGVLIKRYKRFLADVALDNGDTVTAHCPNSGRMTGCCQPGRPVYLSRHDNPKRKLKFTWELIHMPTSMVGVNTLVPNRLVAHCLRCGALEGFSDYRDVQTEAKINSRTRLDIKLTHPAGDVCFIEIKNCTLVENGVAMFPDAPTARGRKHLAELVRLHRQGARSVIFYLIQRCDASSFEPAAAIDPDYAQGLREAVKKGVEVMAYDVRFDADHGQHRIALNRTLPHGFQ